MTGPTASYRWLRPRRLAWQAGVVAAAEVGLYTSYAGYDSRFHWATHFLVGLIAASLWQVAALLLTSRPTRFAVLSVLGFHLWALWPDLVFRVGVPHYRWMDPFSLGHVSSHEVPGGDDTLLAVALLATGVWAVVLWRWLLSRTAEAAAGLAHRDGLGGMAVLRPQRDPGTTPLAHETYGPDPAGAPEVLVLLHGLGATSATWLPAGRRIAASGRAVLVPDLLGFGSSMRLGTRFGLAEQSAAVLRLLDQHGVQRAHLVGHSWGCAVAAAVAVRRPERVAALTLVAPAVFSDPARARERLAARSVLTRATLRGSRAGRLACALMCLLRPLLSRLAPRIEPDVPAQVARDGVQHTYAAYSDAVTDLWEDNPVTTLLAAPPAPTTVVLADGDTTVVPDDVLSLPIDRSVNVVRLPGTHGLAYEQPELVADVVLGAPTGTGA